MNAEAYEAAGAVDPSSKPNEVERGWPKFYFSGNQAWGWIESRADWDWLKAMHMRGWHVSHDEAAARLMDALSLHTGEPEFGLYGEYACAPSLREFFVRHHIDA